MQRELKDYENTLMEREKSESEYQNKKTKIIRHLKNLPFSNHLLNPLTD
jgi:hypothetical protein